MNIDAHVTPTQHPSSPILTVGSVAFDSVKTPFGEVSRVVAGAATYFSIAASFFTDVRLVEIRLERVLVADREYVAAAPIPDHGEDDVRKRRAGVVVHP